MAEAASATQGVASRFVQTRSFGAAFTAELKVLLPDLGLPANSGEGEDLGAPDDESKVEVAPRVVANALDALPERDDLAALCLSGGGIRSASFGLGVLQGLARCGWLDHFHYLSTVSGGGYIGSWFSAWRAVQDDRTVVEGLTSTQATGAEPSQIRGIRANSNYITPQLGLFSADTWSVLAIYLRNLLLNWALFLPFLTGCLLFPHWWVSVLGQARESAHPHPEWWLGGGCALLTFALSCAVCGRFRSRDRWVTQGRFLLLVLTPIVLSAMAFTLAAASGGLHAALGAHVRDDSEQLVAGV